MTQTRVREARFPAAEAPEPGQVRMVEVGEHRIGVFAVDGRLHALADRCPHRGGPLCSRGEVVSRIQADESGVMVVDELALVRCPWHKWDFDVATGRCIVDDRLRVRRYSVRVEGDEIVVGLESPGA